LFTRMDDALKSPLVVPAALLPGSAIRTVPALTFSVPVKELVPAIRQIPSPVLAMVPVPLVCARWL